MAMTSTMTKKIEGTGPGPTIHDLKVFLNGVPNDGQLMVQSVRDPREENRWIISATWAA